MCEDKFTLELNRSFERGITNPKEKRNLKAIWEKMKPGDSILFPTNKPTVASSVLCGSVRYYREAHHPKWKFTVRNRMKTEGGMRVWRLL